MAELEVPVKFHEVAEMLGLDLYEPGVLILDEDGEAIGIVIPTEMLKSSSEGSEESDG
jgi:hypothetical protein